MSFADIFVTEEYIDGAEEDYTEIKTQSPQVEAVITEPEEPQRCLDDNSDIVKEADSSSDMTLKQGEPDDQLVDDGLLFKPGDLPLPVVMLEKYVNSDITFNRQKVVHNLLETLRLVQRNKDEVTRVIQVLCTLSDDYDPIVRTELMGQFPYIAAFCNENGLNTTVQEYLLPILVSYLGAENNQVRKTAHTALLTIVEQKQIDTETVTEKICRLVVHLTDSIHLESFRTDSVELMSKLAVLVGKKVTEDLFLQRFMALCVDKANYVRKACAFNFGDICTTVGTEITEELLLPKFIELCKDKIWGVRRACAEIFMSVSSVVSREIRCSELTDIYMVLLKDQSRWVRCTAYQGLGPFISTFAEPYKTGLYYSEGELVICDVQKLQDALLQIINKNSKNMQSTENSSDVDRTSSSEPCDNIVPLGCSERSLSASEIPGIPCYVGNYSTVIEVSCPSVTASAAKDGVTDDVMSLPPIENGSRCFHTYCYKKNSISGYKNRNMVNHFSYSEDSVSESSNGWYDCVYKKLTPVMNGDCNETKDVDSNDCETIENVVPSPNSVTINGICISTSEVHSEPLSYQTVPVTNCIINRNCSINRSKQIIHGNEDSIKKMGNVYSSELNISEENERFPDYVHMPGDTVADSETQSESNNVSVEQNSGSTVSFDDESAFNHFQYWRTPIPDIDIDSLSFELCNSRDTFNNKSRTSIQDQSALYGSVRQSGHFENRHPRMERNTVWYDGTSENKEGEPPPPGQNSITPYDQDIVPPELLLCYLNMMNSALTEIAHHCAYSLPAVAITLGRKFWPCLKDTFDALSSDLQGFIMMWKVRRTVASSMHQLAVILGPEITSRDLLPVFSRFIKDLDEVRIGILQHLSEFLKELRPEERKQFLPGLSEFLVSNSDTESKEKNWRFRLILAEQLVPVADLYEPEDVKEHLVPLSLTLIQDKICEVRLAAVRVMAAVMKRMSQHPTPTLTKEVLSELTEKFIHSPKWFHRQLYVYICQEFIVQNSLPPDQFAEDALPQLLYLCWDRVPNVRIAIARCLAVIIWPLETFSSPDSPHRELLLQTIHTLQSDLDVDVQFYANMVSTLECSCLQHGEFTNIGELPV